MILQRLFALSLLLTALALPHTLFALGNKVKIAKASRQAKMKKKLRVPKAAPKQRNLPKPIIIQKAQTALKPAMTAAAPTLINLVQQKKLNLKTVKESLKNQYAKQILAEKSPYNAKADFIGFIKKLRIDDGFVIENQTAHPIELRVKYEAKAAPEFYKKHAITVQPGELYVFDKQEGAHVQAIKLADKNAQVFLNPKFTEDGYLQISIQQTEDRYFLHQHHPFDFTSKRFTVDELRDPTIPQEERTFRADFNGSCDFIEYMGHQEGISLEYIDQQRRDLYTKNNIGTLVQQDRTILDTTVYRIPLITHKIWVTSDRKPVDPSPQYIEWLINSIEHNQPSQGWTHYFWIENKAKLPQLVAALESHPTITLMELDALDTSTFVTGDLYKSAIKENKWGKATDIIRLELLKKFGGYYLDTDYELFQSLLPYSKVYDLVVGLEPMSAYLCNAFIGACPDHPVVNKGLELINRNMSQQAPDYVKNAPNNGFKTIVETGPAMFTAAFALAGGNDGYTDIVLPPQTIYPAAKDIYPYKKVVVPNGKIPAQAIGAHYWNTAWMDPKFGGRG